MIESGKLLDKWLPPEGVGQPIGCIATSFTFEADFFQEACLSRFLGFDGVRGETSELSYVIEEEERLAETSVTAIVDRSQNPGNRNLRWDLLAVSPPADSCTRRSRCSRGRNSSGSWSRRPT